jgi:hypothetical protein
MEISVKNSKYITVSRIVAGIAFIWISWSVPLLIAEVILQWDKK